MSYRHSMTCYTEGIRPLVPAQWRSFDGIVGVYWDAEGQSGAKAYYLSPDPRIVIFFNDVSPHIQMTNREGGIGRDARPMTRAVYVPAGVPLWTAFTSSHRFSHLDIHLHSDRLLRFIAPALGGAAARSILRRPVEIENVGPIETLAELLVEELAAPTRHAVYGESLVGSIATALLDLPAEEKAPASGRLTQAQLKKLRARFDARTDGRLSVAEMAQTVGLSESWFTHVFKLTTGETPQQWQRTRRVALAQKLLTETDLTVAEIALQLGFADQAHLTKAFRQVAGDTPASWRRLQRYR
nr:AraC family transcriptional regulator [Rhizobium sp. Khangiran2]